MAILSGAGPFFNQDIKKVFINYKNFPGLDGLPLPTTPITGYQMLDSWRISISN